MPSVLVLLAWACLSSAVLQAGSPGSDKQVQALIDAGKAPVGVVFEVAAEHGGLQWALPKIKGYVGALRARYPQMKFAVVSHGDELFALQKKYRRREVKTHQMAKNLFRDEQVPIHICQTYAGWSGVQPEDFPDYVSVSTQGPQEIKNYQEFGYQLIRVTR